MFGNFNYPFFLFKFKAIGLLRKNNQGESCKNIGKLFYLKKSIKEQVVQNNHLNPCLVHARGHNQFVRKTKARVIYH